MEFRRIEIEDKELFKERLANREHENINFNFTVLFLWQDWGPYVWADYQGAICLKRKDSACMSVSPPLSPDDDKIINATKWLMELCREKNKPFVMLEVTESYLNLFNKAFPGKFIITEDRNSANYIYKTSDLAFLKGRKYASKRNHINRFFRENPDYKLVPLTRELIPACLEVMDTWSSYKNKSTASLEQEKRGIITAFDYFGRLDYTGACLMVGNRIVAFTLGEPISKSTVGIIIEKADYNYHGAFAAINSLFLKEYWLKYPYVNRDEDLGDEGMRMAKTSYHPCKLNMKYTLRLKEG